MHLSLATLEERFRDLSLPPLDRGTIALVVVRPESGARSLPARCRLTAESGLDGDRWFHGPKRKPGSQITLIRADVARLVADGERPELCGDNLHVDLDLSIANLPAGTRLRAGTAVLEVTPDPHTGCSKFSARFGADARAWTNSPGLAPLRLRGIHARVAAAGEVSPGDPIEVLSRPPA